MSYLLDEIEEEAKRQRKAVGRKKETQKKEKTEPEQLASQLASKPVSQPAGHQPLSVEIGPVIAQGRMFYITEKVDEWLDKAVVQLKKRGIHKADRSVVVNAILHNPKLYNPSSLAGIEKDVVRHLASRYYKKTQIRS